MISFASPSPAFGGSHVHRLAATLSLCLAAPSPYSLVCAISLYHPSFAHRGRRLCLRHGPESRCHQGQRRAACRLGHSVVSADNLKQWPECICERAPFSTKISAIHALVYSATPLLPTANPLHSLSESGRPAGSGRWRMHSGLFRQAPIIEDLGHALLTTQGRKLVPVVQDERYSPAAPQRVAGQLQVDQDIAPLYSGPTTLIDAPPLPFRRLYSHPRSLQLYSIRHATSSIRRTGLDAGVRHPCPGLSS